MQGKEKELSKFLSLILRHAPETIGLTLDSQGWASIDELIAKAKKARRKIELDMLRTVVETNDKQRFTLSDDGRRIRAAQGHSISVDLGLEPTIPPDRLFHGTATQTLDAIFAEGLKPGRRQKVHLSLDEDTARKVGQRHGRPTVLRIDAKRMHAEGFLFWKADNGVWLTDHVPPAFLGF